VLFCGGVLIDLCLPKIENTAIMRTLSAYTMGSNLFILKQAFLFNAVSIVGPIVFFCGVGWFLDRFFHTGRIFLFLSVAVAFVATHILMFRKLQTYSKEINKISPKNDAEKNIK
jgi:hypothetical protein